MGECLSVACGRMTYFELCLLLARVEVGNRRPIRLDHLHTRSRFDIHGRRAANDTRDE